MRYRLRTLLLVVTIVCIALGWIALQMRIVVKRQECARLLYENNGGMVISEGTALSASFEIVMEGDKSRRVSLVRRWLGDENAEAIFFSNRFDSTVLELFPEADVWNWRQSAIEPQPPSPLP
jgi:Vesicle coat complex, various subunits